MKWHRHRILHNLSTSIIHSLKKKYYSLQNIRTFNYSTMNNNKPGRLHQNLYNQWINEIDTFLFDCDGVIWRGESPIEGASMAINYMKSLNKKILFVTNNATKARSTYVKKLATHGIKAEENDIISSASATASFLKKKLGDGDLYVVGEDGLVQELLDQGFHCYGPEDSTKTGYPSPNVINQSIKAVVVGLDRKFSYYKLAYAVTCVRSIPGCQFIATNRDATYPADGCILPGGGSIVSCLETGCGREPDAVVGKPSKDLIEAIIDMHKLNPSRSCMVGDRLNTDIQFGNKGGLRTLLVLTGVTLMEDLKSIPSKEQYPEYYLDSINDILKLANLD